MKIYADSRARRTRQIVADLVFVGWITVWMLIGLFVHDAVMQLAVPAERTDQAATGLAGHLRTASGKLRDVPLVGDTAASPFDLAAGSADSLAEAGRRGVDAVTDLAFWLTLSIIAIPVSGVGVFFIPVRVRFVRNATAGRALIEATEDLNLFALRALTRQPLHVLAKISDDPAGAWKAGDTKVISALAGLELRDAGLA
jgi:hypothetical protein